jgi:hypothetical protein
MVNNYIIQYYPVKQRITISVNKGDNFVLFFTNNLFGISKMTIPLLPY